MNLTTYTKITFFTIALLFAGTSISVAAFWAPANGAGSCENVCRNNNSTAIASGTYKNGQKFFVCSANAKGEGVRAGYNLKPNWANACVVGWGGKELFVNNYSCGCN